MLVHIEIVHMYLKKINIHFQGKKMHRHRHRYRQNLCQQKLSPELVCFPESYILHAAFLNFGFSKFFRKTIIWTLDFFEMEMCESKQNC